MDGSDWKEERVPPRAHFEIFYFRVYYFLNASIAQLVEQLALNETVVGSNPTGGTIMKSLHF